MLLGEEMKKFCIFLIDLYQMIPFPTHNACRCIPTCSEYTKEAILGSDLMTLINKATNQNEKNQVQKDEKKHYLENEKNSIKIEVKFLESDKIYTMEAISYLGSEAFIKNYNSMQFICTKKEYHKNTNYIKYMLFEQI